MVGLLKRFWQYLALLGGIALILFELLKRGGPTSDSWFWLIVGVLIVILSIVEITHRWREKPQNPENSGD